MKEVKCSMCIVLCKDNPYSLVNVLGPFPVILQPRSFYKVKFTDTFGADETTRKITKYFDLSAFKWNLNYSNLKNS